MKAQLCGRKSKEMYIYDSSFLLLFLPPVNAGMVACTLIVHIKDYLLLTT